MSRKYLILFLVSLSLTLNAGKKKVITVNKNEKYIDVSALYIPSNFNSRRGLKNHHFIVWKNGEAAKSGIFLTQASDASIHDSLLVIGAVPGNNLTEETWTMTKDMKSSEPDKHVKGTQLDISILTASGALKVSEIIQDRTNKNPKFRFGGNRDLIPVWQSGCVVCLQSCPGAKVSNEIYTMRDLENGISQFDLKKNTPIKENEKVIIRFKIHDTNHKGEQL